MKPNELTLERLAEVMCLSPEGLVLLAASVADGYDEPREKVIKGKCRTIAPPKPRLKSQLRRLHRFIQRAFKIHPAAHGGVTGRSCFTSARCHLGRKFIIKRDLRDCYPSIGTGLLCSSLRRYGFSDEVSEVLASLMTLNGSLPQGSPVSGDALNICLADLDAAIASMAGQAGVHYSRVADDFVLSGDVRKAVKRLARELEIRLWRLGLIVNPEKRRKHGYLPPWRQQRVHNIGVRNPRGLTIVTEHSTKFLTQATSFVRAARCVSPASLEKVALIRQRIEGAMHYCRNAEFSPAAHIWTLIRTGDELVRRRLRQDHLPFNWKWWVISTHRNEPRRLAEAWSKIQSSRVGVAAG